nr:hypothetical protein [Tanacetum cinerariifolium]
MSFSKRPGKNTPQCYTKPLDSLKNWNNSFFWVDERVFPTVVDWRINASKDGMPVNGTYSVEAVRALDTHRTSIQKQPEMLLCLVGISRRYYLGDEVNRPIQFDSWPKSYKGKNWEPPSCPHEVPLLTLTASRVIEIDELAVATDSSGVSSTIEKSPLDFANEDGPLTKELLPPRCRRPRIDPDPLSFADAPSHHPVDVAQSSPGVVAAKDPESENASSPTEVGFKQKAKLLRKSVAQVARRDKRIEARELEIK